eukprot:scaffold457579_cov35-Prasinocladus_malaysianus.AAC.1
MQNPNSETTRAWASPVKGESQVREKKRPAISLQCKVKAVRCCVETKQATAINFDLGRQSIQVSITRI